MNAEGSAELSSTAAARVAPMAAAPRVVARVAGVLAGLIGLLALLGWQFNIAALRSGLPGLTATNPLSALCFLAAGLALWLLAAPVAGPRARAAAQVLAVAVALAGALKLSDFLFGLNLGLDQIVYHARLT